MKLSLIVLFGLVVTSLIRKRSAATRHFVLAAALLCAAATPALRLIAPAWHTSFGALGTLGTGWSASPVEILDRPLVVLEETPATASGAVQPQRSGCTSGATTGWYRWPRSCCAPSTGRAHRHRRVDDGRAGGGRRGSCACQRGDQCGQRVGVHADASRLPANRGANEGGPEFREREIGVRFAARGV